MFNYIDKKLCFNGFQLPSFMRKKYLIQMEKESKLHYIYNNNVIVGFYVLDNEKFKSLFIIPTYRKNGLATKTIKETMNKQIITIATTKRLCNIKKLIIKLGFQNTGLVVQGKQSKLEIWKGGKE